MNKNRVIAGMGIIGLAVLALMLTLTSPTEIGPFGVLLFFTTIYVVSFSITVLLFRVFLRLAFKRTSLQNKEYLYAAVAAFSPIMLLIARSFGAVSIWTVSLIVIFIFLAEFLVAKRI